MAHARAATAVYVLYNTRALELDWIPADVPVVLVHNDDSFDVEACSRTGVTHIRPGGNVGFGAGVNAALPAVITDRVVLVNPDTTLGVEHWNALTAAESHEIVAIPLVEADGTATVVVRPHYTPVTLVLTAWRVGRLVGYRRRRRPGPLALSNTDMPAKEVWASAGCVSLPVAPLREVGGFDERYFLYFEDADLGYRLAGRFPSIRVRIAAVRPGVHSVGGTATTEVTASAHASSARLYAAQRRGWDWRLAEAAASLRCRRLNARTGAAS